MKYESAKKYRLGTSWLRALPDFVVIGAQKSGTTTLFTILSEHPQVMSPFNKEPHYFDNNFYKPLTTGYRFQFPLKAYMLLRGMRHRSSVITGEATPFYLFHPLVPGRMKKVIPKARLLVILREPVERAYSHYQYAVKNGNETRSFADAISHEVEQVEAEKEKLKKGQSFDNRLLQNNSYISRSHYHEQLERWFQYYSPEQLFILSSEYFFSRHQEALEQIRAFLGLNLNAYPPRQELPVANPNAYHKMDTGIYHRLRTYFEPLNEELFQLIGKRLWWH